MGLIKRGISRGACLKMNKRGITKRGTKVGPTERGTKLGLAYHTEVYQEGHKGKVTDRSIKGGGLPRGAQLRRHTERGTRGLTKRGTEGLNNWDLEGGYQEGCKAGLT